MWSWARLGKCKCCSATRALPTLPCSRRAASAAPASRRAPGTTPPTRRRTRRCSAMRRMSRARAASVGQTCVSSRTATATARTGSAPCRPTRSPSPTPPLRPRFSSGRLCRRASRSRRVTFRQGSGAWRSGR
eukprot:Amastigsp_a340810_67.p5 type:complete len:132 gc:universal Amastigsp_a340810_67:327-722(+)